MLGEGRKFGMKGGDLDYLVKNESKYPYLWDKSIGNWSTSKTVRSVFVMASGGPTAAVTLFNNEFMTAGDTTPAPVSAFCSLLVVVVVVVLLLCSHLPCSRCARARVCVRVCGSGGVHLSDVVLERGGMTSCCELEGGMA